VHALNTNNQKLRRMIVGLVVVNLMALLLLSIVGIESLPFLLDAVRNMVL
jgi:hypothetical protein